MNLIEKFFLRPFVEKQDKPLKLDFIEYRKPGPYEWPLNKGLRI